MIRQSSFGIPPLEGAFSPDGRLVASGSDNRTIKLWDTTTGSLQRTLEGHSGSVRSVAFSPDGRLVASGSDDRMIKLWDATTGFLQQSLAVEGLVTNLTFSEDCLYLDTNLGSLNIQLCYDGNASISTYDNTKVFIQYQWVTFQGAKVLWLPPEYRPFCSAVKGGTLVIGHDSGQVHFMEFCT